jgi:hypothetical protein
VIQQRKRSKGSNHWAGSVAIRIRLYEVKFSQQRSWRVASSGTKHNGMQSVENQLTFWRNILFLKCLLTFSGHTALHSRTLNSWLLPKKYNLKKNTVYVVDVIKRNILIFADERKGRPWLALHNNHKWQDDEYKMASGAYYEMWCNLLNTKQIYLFYIYKLSGL